MTDTQKPEPLQVTYRTTLDDYVAFNLWVMNKAPFNRIFSYLGYVLGPLMIIAAKLEHSASALDTLPALALSVSGLLVTLFYPLVYRWLIAITIRSQARRMGTKGSFGPITLNLTQERLVAISETTRSEAPWKEMHGIEIDGEYTYIRVTGLSALIMPRHGFCSNEEYEKVRNFALDRLRQRPTDEQRHEA